MFFSLTKTFYSIVLQMYKNCFQVVSNNIFKSIFTYSLKFSFINIYIYIYTHIYIYVYVYIYIHTKSYVHSYMQYIYVGIQTYMCLYTYIKISSYRQCTRRIAECTFATPKILNIPYQFIPPPTPLFPSETNENKKGGN